MVGIGIVYMVEAWTLNGDKGSGSATFRSLEAQMLVPHTIDMIIYRITETIYDGKESQLQKRWYKV